MSLRAVLLLAVLTAGCSAEQPPAAFGDPEWTFLSSGTDERLQAVFAVSDSVVWASGTGGMVVRSTDGGMSWASRPVRGAETLELRDVHAFSEAEAFVMSAGMGADSRIYRTRDGGTRWEEVYRADQPSAFFDCMSFWDRERGLVFSDATDSDFLLLSTLDGGDTWTRIPPEILDDARPGEGAFASSGTCLVTAGDGHAWFGTGASAVDTRVFRSKGHGAEWSAVVTPIPSNTTSQGIFSVAFADTAIGLAVGGDYARPDSLYAAVIVTDDGGRSWARGGGTGLGGSVYGAAIVPGAPTTTAVAVAPTGSAYSIDGGRSWIRIGGENFWAVGSSPEGSVWAVGPGGQIARLEFSPPTPDA